MIPPGERVVTTYLQAHAGVSALARVANKTPSKFTQPWVRVTQLDAPSVGGHRSDHLIEFFLQFDCYAGAEGERTEADLVTRTVREALRVMPDVAHDDAVVTGVEFLSCPRLPDTDFEPARERYALSALVHMHS